MVLKILQLLLFGRNQRHEVSGHDPVGPALAGP